MAPCGVRVRRREAGERRRGGEREGMKDAPTPGANARCGRRAGLGARGQELEEA